jgi:hypothetical protein
MSADKPSEAKTPTSRPGSGYRTLMPAGAKPGSEAPPPRPAAKPDPSDSAKASPSLSRSTKDASPPDPTRFGDWEVKGRCIDF